MRDREYDDQKDEPTKRLDEDNDPPFSQPADTKQRIAKDHPVFDNRSDEHEEYDEGSDDAALDEGPRHNKGSGNRPHKLF